jgi:hypothetical protein
MDIYYVIIRGQDKPYIVTYSKAKLEKVLSDEYSHYTAMEGLNSFDLMCFPVNSYFIIKGHCVVPRRVEVVTKFEV